MCTVRFVRYISKSFPECSFEFSNRARAHSQYSPNGIDDIIFDVSVMSRINLLFQYGLQAS